VGIIAEIEQFWERPLESLDHAQWEALCDGCGKCCLLKAEDEDDGKIYLTNIACKLLDIETAKCSDYRNRRKFVADCIRLNLDGLNRFEWLPDSCSYVLRANNKPLPKWHYLVSGSHVTIHETGNSIQNKVIPETEAGPIEHHILTEPI